MRKTLVDQTVLVTGGAGFIGSHLVDRLILEGVKQVVVIDNLFVGSEENLRDAAKSGKLVVYKDDAEFSTSLEYIFEKHKIDSVFNCATKALNYSFINPANAFDTNVKVIINLLELQRKRLFRTLCHFSTSEVYGTAIYEPMDELHPKNPTTTYAAGKAAADMALESYVRMFDLDAFVVRPFNNYGPRQNYRGILAGVIPVTVLKIMKGERPEIHGSGNQSRDFIYVEDTVDAIVSLYSKLSAGESVNISTDNTCTIAHLVTEIARRMQFDGEIERKEERKSDVFCHVACNKKIKNIIDYELTPFDIGLNKTIEWYKKNIRID